MLSFRDKAAALLETAGIAINGKNPWDIRIHDERFFERTLRGGSVAFGEAYMDDWWGVEELDAFFTRIFEARLDEKVQPMALFPHYLKALLRNPQKGKRAYKVGEVHYDVGNELYAAMLDRRMTYTCGYWDRFQELPEAQTLDQAQEHKLEMICRKVGLKEGDKVLDIGCGWGSFIRYAAEKYGARCVGISISKEQVRHGNETRGDLPIEFRLQDYRDMNETFDHIVSVGMFEHVGYKNYRTYMRSVCRNLNENGNFLLHTIGTNVSTFSADPWITKYIFPNSMLPSAAQISKAVENIFIIEDWHNFGPHYDRTLMAWYENFQQAWPELKDRYDDRFYRMWEFYLLASAAAFRSRTNQLWQIVLTKNGARGGYKSLR